jgi:hypothetical protein
MEYYTYAYLREDKTPWYIGKGKGRRAYQKHDYFSSPSKDKILILKNNLTEQEAYKHEIYMINIFGRKDLGTGILCNKTNGGDAPPVFTGHTEESKRKISKSLKGRVTRPPHTKEQRLKFSLKQKELGIKPPLQAKEFSFTSPEGIVYSGTNITNFSREHNLSLNALISLRCYKQYTHKGWTLTNSCKIKNTKPTRDWNRPGFGKKYCLKSPNGIYYYVVVGELSVFANENDLLPNGISRLINGKRKTYRGWKLVK